MGTHTHMHWSSSNSKMVTSYFSEGRTFFLSFFAVCFSSPSTSLFGSLTAIMIIFCNIIYTNNKKHQRKLMIKCEAMRSRIEIFLEIYLEISWNRFWFSWSEKITAVTYIFQEYFYIFYFLLCFISYNFMLFPSSLSFMRIEYCW